MATVRTFTLAFDLIAINFLMTIGNRYCVSFDIEMDYEDSYALFCDMTPESQNRRS
jgi:hypothetical protein